MRKLPQCDYCLFCAHDYHVVCALHPAGPGGETCLDFRPDPDFEDKQFEDFLGIGEEEFENPYSTDPSEEQWEGCWRKLL